MKIIKENKKSEENEEKVACVKLVVVGSSLGQMRYESSFSSKPKRSQIFPTTITIPFCFHAPAIMRFAHFLHSGNL